MPSVTYLRPNDVSVICRVTYIQFPILSAFLPYMGRQAAPALRRTIGFNTQYRTSDVAENLGRHVSCMERTAHGKDFELILMVKMETRHPVEGRFRSEFPAIYIAKCVNNVFAPKNISMILPKLCFASCE